MIVSFFKLKLGLSGAIKKSEESTVSRGATNVREKC